jgi:pimeloyl-ACP methyl ester carboxylesterase
MTENKYQSIFNIFRENHPPKGMLVNGKKWEYLTGGDSSEAILLLHGGGSIAEATFRFFIDFEKNYKVIAPTLPNTLATVEDVMNGLLEIMAAEGVSKVSIVGFSMGGMVAQAFIRKYPERVNKLILFVSMLPSPDYAKKYSRYRRYMSLFPKSWVSYLSKLSLKKQITAENVIAPLEEKTFWKDFFSWTFDSGKMDKSTLLSTSDVLVDYFQNYKFNPDDLNEWNGSILIYEAEKDKVVNEKERQNLRSLYPNAEIITLENSGHFGLGLVQPEEIINKMLIFLK